MFDSLFPKEWTTLQRLMWLKTNALARAVYEIVTGNPVSFTAKAAPLRQLEVAFSPVQDLHGYDAPWPAGGGKNKFDSSLMADASTGAKFITLNLKPNTAYTMSSDDPCKDNGTITDLFFCNMDESVSSGTNGVKLNKSITRTSDANGQLRVGYRCYEGWITPEQLIAYHSQVEEGNTATSFASYSNICPISGWDSLTVYHSGADTSNPQTISINIGQTVYSGWVDLVTGVVTVDMAMVDLGSFNWNTGNRNNEDTGRVFYVTGLPVGSTNSLCSIYKQGTQSWEDMHANNYYLSATGTFMVCADYANKTDFATAVTGQTLCYELATPLTIQLTPQEVESLEGDNTMWSNANQPITVEYRSN